MPGAILGVVALVLAMGTAAPAAVPGPGCPPAQYTVVGVPLGADAARSTTVEIDARVGLGPLCPMFEPRRVETSRRGVIGIRQRWDACAGLHGAVRLSPAALPWTAAGADLQITLPPDLPAETAYVFALS